MIKSNKLKSLFILETILLIYVVIFKLYIINMNELITNIVICVFWIVFGIITYFLYGFPKDNNYLKSSTKRLVIMVLLMYFFSIYLFGIFLGFTYSLYSKNIFVQLYNIIPFVIMYTSMELSRYMIYSKKVSKIQKNGLVILYVILNIIMGINGVSIESFGKLFIVTCTIIMPIIANEMLLSYITDNTSFVPSIIYRLCINLYIYIIPMTPILGNYLQSVIGIFIPFIIFVETRKNVTYHDKYMKTRTKKLGIFFATIIILFMIIMVSLTGGFFKHEFIAIVSSSMEPAYTRGDAIIITKKEASEIKIGDILAFRTSSGIVTHRVVDINNNPNKSKFITKGDNNSAVDLYDIHDEDVIGTVDYILKYAGYPTVWMSGIFERR